MQFPTTKSLDWLELSMIRFGEAPQRNSNITNPLANGTKKPWSSDRGLASGMLNYTSLPDKERHGELV
jgi:hypothetical protein